MKSFWFFIGTTIKGGLFFFVPLVLLGVLLHKAYLILAQLIGPLAFKLGIEKFAGKTTLTIIVLLLILLLCFCGGLLMRIKTFKTFNENLEDVVRTFFPNYKQNIKLNKNEKN